MNEQSTISSLKGIGEKTEKLFQKLNIFTIGDLLRHFPKGYEVYEEATPIAEIDEGRTVTVTGAIYGKVQVSGRTSMQVTTIYVKDITGTLRVVWFRMPFLRNTFQKGVWSHYVEKSCGEKEHFLWNSRKFFIRVSCMRRR